VPGAGVTVISTLQLKHVVFSPGDPPEKRENDRPIHEITEPTRNHTTLLRDGSCEFMDRSDLL